MSSESNAIVLQGTAGADLSGSQYLWVKADGTADEAIVLENSPASRESVGILKNAPGNGGDAWFTASGIARGVAGAALEPYDEVTNDANGKTVVAAAGDLIRGRYIGRFDAVADDQIDILVYSNQNNALP